MGKNLTKQRWIRATYYIASISNIALAAYFVTIDNTLIGILPVCNTIYFAFKNIE